MKMLLFLVLLSVNFSWALVHAEVQKIDCEVNFFEGKRSYIISFNKEDLKNPIVIRDRGRVFHKYNLGGDLLIFDNYPGDKNWSVTEAELYILKWVVNRVENTVADLSISKAFSDGIHGIHLVQGYTPNSVNIVDFITDSQGEHKAKCTTN